jgi:ferritin-like metal-binding protein YciE
MNAREKLIKLLQDAHAGEMAAYHAYEGHWRSVSDPNEKKEIQKIQAEEIEHRECLGQFLIELGAAPRPGRERLMALIGRTIGLLCRLGGWFIPMYGAGQLEQGNIVEYETAARLARAAGLEQYVEPLLKMAEVEWDHEAFFRAKVQTHWAARLVPLWPTPPPRENIRIDFLKGDT